MKTEVLKEFITLAQYLNYSVAAEKLYMPQPRLSVHIAELEAEVGFPLFERGKHLSLTPEGRRFLKAADRALNELEAAIATGVKSSKQEKRRITVMAPPLASQFPPDVTAALSKAFADALRLYPALSTSMPVTCRTSTELDALRDGKTDLGYLLAREEDAANPPEGFVLAPVATTALTAWVTKSNPLSHRESVTLEDLSDLVINVPGSLDIASYREQIVRAFGEKGLNPVYQTTFVESAETVLTQLPKEDEATLGPDYLASFTHFGLVPLKIVDAPPMSLCVAHLSDPPNKFVPTFVDLLTGREARQD